MINITFVLKEPSYAMYFVMPDSYSAPKVFYRSLKANAEQRLPHMYVNNAAGGPRSWFPCVDKDNVKCPWEIEITIPRTVGTSLGLGDNLPSPDMVAVASGDLVDHLIHPKDWSKKIFVYSLKTPVAASSILLAVGPFECLDIPGWGHSAAYHDAYVPDSNEIDRQSEKRMFGGGRTFYLTGRRAQVEHSFGFLYQVGYTQNSSHHRLSIFWNSIWVLIHSHPTNKSLSRMPTVLPSQVPPLASLAPVSCSIRT